MGLFEGGTRRSSVLALMMGVWLAPSFASTASPLAEDWRTLRRIDLPAELVRAAWSDEYYLGDGHPIQVGRTTVKMPPGVAARGSIVKASNNAADGILIDNLTCYNTVRGQRKCGLLLNLPNYCHLFVYAESGTSDSEDFDVACPAYLTLGR
jgi:hypothetical protein